jgi:parallel beta-helix repeat protein
MANTTYTVNVADYGAVGDGVIDDYAAITRAITAAGPGGSVVFQSGRTYKLSAALTITNDNMRFMGYGAKLIGSSEAQYVMFTCTSRTNVQFYGFTLDGAWVSAAAAVNNGLIDLITCSKITVADCTFQNTADCGVRVLGACSDILIRDNRFTAYGTAIFGNTSGGTQPVNCRIVGNYLGAAISGGSGITFHGTASAPYGGHTIANNILEGTIVQGIELQTSVDSCAVTGNTIRGVTMGISLSGSKKMTVSGNVINAPSTYGIEVAACSEVTVTGNTIDGRSAAGVLSTGNAISLNSGSTFVTVTGNHVTGFTGTHVDLQYSDNIKIMGNNIAMIIGITNGAHGINAKAWNDLSICGNSFSTVSGFDFVFLDADYICNGLNLCGNMFSGRADVAGISFYTANATVGFRSLLFEGNNTARADSAGFMALPSPGFISGAQAFGNLGPGTQDFNKAISVPVYSSTANATLDFRWDTLLMDATSGPRTGYLPTAEFNLGQQFTVIKTDSSANRVAVVPVGAQTINGLSSWVVSGQGQGVTVRSDASNWRVVGVQY